MLNLLLSQPKPELLHCLLSISDKPKSTIKCLLILWPHWGKYSQWVTKDRPHRCLETQPWCLVRTFIQCKTRVRHTSRNPMSASFWYFYILVTQMCSSSRPYHQLTSGNSYSYKTQSEHFWERNVNVRLIYVLTLPRGPRKNERNLFSTAF